MKEANEQAYDVVINSECQYSLWPLGRPLPDGWKKAGKQGAREECLEYVRANWTDMRPLSLRKKDARTAS